MVTDKMTSRGQKGLLRPVGWSRGRAARGQGGGGGGGGYG